MWYFSSKVNSCNLAILGCIVLLSACGREDQSQPKTLPTTQAPKMEAQPVSTRLKWLPGATYIGTIAAKEAGLFRQQGLDVSIFPGGFEADPIKLVAAGSNDFGITGAEQLLLARANGVPIVAIFMELRYSPAGWMTLKASNITKPQDFIGKKVGAQYGTNIEPTLDALLAKLNIDSKKLTRIPVKYDVAPLFAGQVDVLPVYLTGQPVQARLEGKEVNSIDPADYGIRLYGNVYFTSEKMIKEKPETVQKFVNGLTAGWKMAVAQPEQAIDLLIKAEPRLEKNMELSFLKATVPFIKGGSDAPLGVMSTKGWQETKNIMSKYAGLSASVDINAAFTNEFVNSAYGAIK